MSNALLEAMACGLPVICARTGGADLLVRDNGIVLDKISYESLANAIKKLMISPAIATMGKKSRMIAQGNSWKKVAHQYLMVYKRLIHA
jgi:glycosyltransferase involved in cell wall biosynthesis